MEGNVGFKIKEVLYEGNKRPRILIVDGPYNGKEFTIVRVAEQTEEKQLPVEISVEDEDDKLLKEPEFINIVNSIVQKILDMIVAGELKKVANDEESDAGSAGSDSAPPVT